MKTIKLCLDFLNGPIWKDEYDVKNGTLITGVKVIDTDSLLQQLDNAVQDMYSSFYFFDISDEGYRFDEDAFEATKESLFVMLKKIKIRLVEINDGSFVVEDCLLK